MEELTEDGAPVGNPLFHTPGLGPTPQTGPVGFQSNPVWSPEGEERQERHWWKEQEQQPANAVETEDEIKFAESIQAAHSGELDSAGAVLSYAAILSAHARLLREKTLNEHQRNGMSSLRLEELATSLEAEAATWKLFFKLHGIPDSNFPAGSGGPTLSPDGSAATVHQHCAELLASQPLPNRVARVVVWLEELAAEQLDGEDAAAERRSGSRPAFSEREGLPLSTRDELQEQAAGDAMPSQLDPDAATRQGKRWAGGDEREEGRILDRLWRLLRAGRAAEARELCCTAGQPWRAACLGGPPGPGPIPLGTAAIQVDCDEGGIAQQQLAAEVDLDGGALRGMWRWTCFQAAEQIAKESPIEAGIFGVLGGNLRTVLPLCRTWNDRLWALSRSWLEAALDAECPPSQAAEEQFAPDLAIAAAAAVGGQAEVTAEGCSLLSSQSPNARSKQLISTPADALQVTTATQQQSCSAAQIALLLQADYSHEFSEPVPQSWEDIQEHGLDSLVLDENRSFGERQQLLQWQLILGPEENNYSRLLLDVLPACVPEGSSDKSRLRAKMLRFSAHLGLALVDLGILPEPHDTAAPPDFHSHQAQINQLLFDYLAHLLEEGKYELLPAYVCRLCQAPRRQLSCSLLFEMTCHSTAEARQQAYEDLGHWLSLWAEQGKGDVSPHELSIVVQLVAHTRRWDFAVGPELRARMAAWLWLGPLTLVPAFCHTNAMLREFALGGDVASVGAHTLLQALPEELQAIMSASEQEAQAWAEALLEAGQILEEDLSAVLSGLLELQAWWTYFELDRAFGEWCDAVQRREHIDSRLKEEGVSLVDAYLTFLSADPEGGPAALERLATPAVQEEARCFLALCTHFQELEVKLWVTAPRPEGEDVGSPSGALMSHPVAEQLAENLQRLLEPFLTEMQDCMVEVAATSSDEAGAWVEIHAAADSVPQLHQVASLLALAIKGHLHDEPTSPLQVVNMDGNDAATRQICQAVAYPAAALNVALLRSGLVQHGEGLEVGANLALLVAGTDQSTGFKGLSPHFSPQELRLLFDCERRTLAQHLVNEQQQ